MDIKPKAEKTIQDYRLWIHLNEKKQTRLWKRIRLFTHLRMLNKWMTKLMEVFRFRKVLGNYGRKMLTFLTLCDVLFVYLWVCSPNSKNILKTILKMKFTNIKYVLCIWYIRVVLCVCAEDCFRVNTCEKILNLYIKAKRGEQRKFLLGNQLSCLGGFLAEDSVIKVSGWPGSNPGSAT